MAVEPDTKEVGEAVPALMYLTLNDGRRAWKSFDQEAIDRFHKQCFIENPANKTKSVVLTERSLMKAGRLFRELFAKK